MKVFVYRNLHRNTFSVKALEGQEKGKVIQYLSDLYLSEGVFKVSRAGRLRVLRDKRKNVHAGCQGKLLSCIDDTHYALSWAEVTYNPYKYDSFVFKDNTEIKVDKFKYCHMKDNRVWISEQLNDNYYHYQQTL